MVRRLQLGHNTMRAAVRENAKFGLVLFSAPSAPKTYEHAENVRTRRRRRQTSKTYKELACLSPIKNQRSTCVEDVGRGFASFPTLELVNSNHSLPTLPIAPPRQRYTYLMRVSANTFLASHVIVPRGAPWPRSPV